MQKITAHLKEIERVATGYPSDRPISIIDSWLRCLNEYQLVPTPHGHAYILPKFRLRRHQQQSEELIRISRAALERLYVQVASHNYMLLLSDACGVSVAHYRNPNFDNALRAAGLYLGSDWSETLTGTCAVGTCLAMRKPVTVHQDDHFDPAHIDLTCSAAPVFDTLGELAAVVDISQLCSPIQRSSQKLAQRMVTATAHQVEMANLVTRSVGHWIVRLSRSPDYVDTAPEAAIAVSPDGVIQGLTHGAFATLSAAVDLDNRNSAALIGQPLTTLFDLRTDDLPRFISGQSTRSHLLCAHGQPILFAVAEPPAVRASRAASVLANTDQAGLPPALKRIAGTSRDLTKLTQRALRYAQRGLPILIQGETGTGKEVLAQAIHEAHLESRPFIAINCAAIPEHLIESELFGHAPNAFTGAARAGKVGLIEAAHGGTLFLDEIGDMPLALQTRLLRVLAERRVTPIGSLQSRAVDIHLISATHAPLHERVADGTFRQDLFYRLNVGVLRLPALRERSDFDALARAVLAEIGSEHGSQYKLSADALRRLSVYSWPGNIRELRNILEVACALCEPPTITSDDLPEQVHATAAKDDLGAQLASCDGNVSELARRLGVDRTTVHRRLKRMRSDKAVH